MEHIIKSSTAGLERSMSNYIIDINIYCYIFEVQFKLKLKYVA